MLHLFAAHSPFGVSSSTCHDTERNAQALFGSCPANIEYRTTVYIRSLSMFHGVISFKMLNVMVLPEFPFPSFLVVINGRLDAHPKNLYHYYLGMPEHL